VAKTVTDHFPKIKFKMDSYTRRRGKPAMLAIYCSSCQGFLMLYQKDGPGPLLRCYLDRIHYPEILESRQKEPFYRNKSPHLECHDCHKLIGTTTIYEKENRPAYHMQVGSFSKKKIY
jgi:hypothetical protein